MAAAQQAGAPPPVWVALDEVTDPVGLQITPFNNILHS